MAAGKKKSLSEGHRKAIGTDKSPTRPAKQHPVPDSHPLKDRYELLKDIPLGIIRKAWFTSAHLLLGPGSKIVDMGCQTGEMAYALAVLNPQMKIVGIDMDKNKIRAAQENHSLPNLEFIQGDVGAPNLFKQNSIDAIINSFIMHEIYSGSHYSDRSVIQTLENQFGLLKPEGIMFLRDFSMPSNSDYVLMEMPDTPSKGNELKDLSEADLLVWYSEQARPRQDPGCNGFFLEELPPRFPKTRLFRLPSKWAYEFIMRKDERDIWEDELPKEYTFFTEREYRKALRSLGARVLYTAPHWDEQYVKANFDGHFRLYDEDGRSLRTPPTSFIAIAQKTGEHSSMRLNERRPTSNPKSSLRINAMRNDIDGRMVDVISRDISTTEVLPWRLTPENELNIFVHIGTPRGIINAVPRNGSDLDGKRWSGHMTETIAISSEQISNIGENDIKGAVQLMRDVIGLKPSLNATLVKGPSFYPAPDFIDERIDTRFIQVEKPAGPVDPKFLAPDLDGFHSKGKIIEISAQSILNAISVGIIPNAQLELQILALYEKLGMKAESWSECPLTLQEFDVQKTDVRDLLVKLAGDDNRYKPARGTTGQWRPLQSVFVEEGQVNGSLTGLAARDLDFVVSDDNTENVAVILPLAKSLSGEVLAGYVLDYLPVPQRYKGNGAAVTAPTLALPREITSMNDARHYIATHFQVSLEHVSKMGESFFCHIGLTPQRIYPFAITAPSDAFNGPKGRGAYAPLDELWKLTWWDNTKSYMKIMSLAYKNLGENSDLSPTWDFGKKLAESHERPVASHATDMRGVKDDPTKTDNNETRKPLPK